jgi:AcrR family transcriptional regulator
MRTKSRQIIMEAAMELFMQRGYHGTSVSMIANQAGVSTGLMYNYFQSKVELLQEIVQEGLNVIQSSMVHIDQIEDPKEKTKAMIDMTFDIARQDMHFWTLYFSILMQPDLPEEGSRIFKEFFDGMFLWLEDLMTKLGVEDPVAEARILGGILDGVLLHYWMAGDKYPFKEVQDLIIRKYCKS